MVSLSMGVLQCNLFANASTVAGESHFNSLCGYSLACGHWDSPQGSSGHLAHLLGIRQDSQQPGEQTQLFTALPPRSGATVSADGYRGGNCFCLSLLLPHLRQARQSPASRPSRNSPRGRTASGQEKTQRGGCSEVHSVSSV